MSHQNTGINLNIGSHLDDEFLNLMAEIPNPLKKIQGISELDLFVLSDRFFKAKTVADSSIDPNANMGSKSPISFQSETSKPQMKYRSYYELWRREKDRYGVDVANEDIRNCINGSLYFHDITKIEEPYCFAFDTSFMMTQGRPYGWLPSVAPKRSSSFMSQLVESAMDMSQEHAGAIGIANLLVNLAYYTKKERGQLKKSCEKTYNTLGFDSAVAAINLYISGLGYEEWAEEEIQVADKTLDGVLDACDKVYNKYVQNLLQNFVHIMHNTFRIGGDSPFTNMSIFDKLTFDSVFADAFYPDYTRVVDNYAEVGVLQKIFIEFFYKGSPTNGKNYRFPVTTINIKTNAAGEIEDKEFFRYAILKNKERGAFNIHVGEKVATCCRLTSDLSKLKDQIRMDSFGNGGLSIGSHRVVAINLHRVALVARDTGVGFKTVLDKYLQSAERLLITHREILKERVDSGFLKFFNIGWEDVNMFFSTIGYTGLIDSYSVCADVSIKSIVEDPELLNAYVEFASETLDYMDDFATNAGTRTESSAYNVEEIPAENASPKLAQADNFLYSDRNWYEHIELLSNQMIPLYYNIPLMRRLEISGLLMNKVSGGSILHLNLTEQVTDEAYIELVEKMIEEYHIPHFAINVGTSVCGDGHTTPGIFQICPVCNKEVVDWNIRVVGFNTDVSSWSPERREEFKRRQFYGASDVTAKNIL